MKLYCIILAFLEAAAVSASKVSVLLDLSTESECNLGENQLNFEGAVENARQRAEAVQWTLARLHGINQIEVTHLGKIEIEKHYFAFEFEK